MLDVNPEDSIENVKKKFRRLSILVHPDKNQDDAERAMSAFDAVKKVCVKNTYGKHLPDPVSIEGRFPKKFLFSVKIIIIFQLI